MIKKTYFILFSFLFLSIFFISSINAFSISQLNNETSYSLDFGRNITQVFYVPADIKLSEISLIASEDGLLNGLNVQIINISNGIINRSNILDSCDIAYTKVAINENNNFSSCVLTTILYANNSYAINLNYPYTVQPKYYIWGTTPQVYFNGNLTLNDVYFNGNIAFILSGDEININDFDLTQSSKNIFVAIADFFGNILPSSSGLTTTEALGIVLIIFLIVDGLLFWGGYSVGGSSNGKAILWIILFIDILLFCFFTAIGYIPVGVIIVLVLILLVIGIFRIYKGGGN